MIPRLPQPAARRTGELLQQRPRYVASPKAHRHHPGERLPDRRCGRCELVATVFMPMPKWYSNLVPLTRELEMSVTASEARKQLFRLIEKVNNDHVAVEITSRRGNAVLVSADEYAALEETAYLLRVPANAKRLVESLQQAKAGDRHEHELAE